jgi:hypothetical protein
VTDRRGRRRHRRQRQARQLARAHRRPATPPVQPPPTPTHRAAVICHKAANVGAANRTQWRIYPSRADAEAAMAQPCPFAESGCSGVHGIACADRWAGKPIVSESTRLKGVDEALDAIIAARRRLKGVTQ